MDATPTPSPVLDTTQGRHWASKMNSVHALLNSAMRTMHPHQYAAVQALGKSLQVFPAVASALGSWDCTPFNALSIIVNRESPLHRDPKTDVWCYDLMVSVGMFKTVPMLLEGLEVRIENTPGTVIALPGKSILHGVSRCTGDQVCYAYYAREALYDRLHVQLPGFPEQCLYEEWLGTNRGYVHSRPSAYASLIYKP